MASRLPTRALSHSGLLMLERVLTLVLGLGVNVLLARYLGTGAFGDLNYVIAFTALFTPLFTVGLNALLTREIINRPEEEGRILGSACLARFAGGLASLTILVALHLSGLSVQYLGGWILLVAAGRIGLSLSVVEFWFHAHEDFKTLVWTKLLALIPLSAAKVAVVVLDLGLEALLIILCAEALFRSLLMLAGYLVRRSGEQRWQFDPSHGLALVRRSSWLILSGFASIIYLKIDQVMLKTFLDSSAVGTYAVAARLSEVWYFLPTAVATALFPTLLQWRKTQRARYERGIQDIADLLFWMAFGVAIATTLVAEPFIVLLFGQEYLEAAAILKIHIWAGLFVFMRAVASKWLIAEDLLAFSLVTHGVGAVANVGANLLLIPVLEGEGAALATLVSYSASSYFAFFIAPSTRPMAVRMTLAPLAPLRRLLRKDPPANSNDRDPTGTP